MNIDLRKGVCETTQYNAWVFPGGEIHLKLKVILDKEDNVNLIARLNTSQDIMFSFIMIDTIKKDYPHVKLSLTIPYMPYQQADRNFSVGESFTLKMMCNLINSFNLNEVIVFDPHSDVTPALINNCYVINNSKFISDVISLIGVDMKNLVIVSPDAGAYKKIFKICSKINFTGDIVTCSKSRCPNSGELTSIVPQIDPEKTILIVDDICLAGNTFLKIREQIQNKNVYLAVSHGILNDNVKKLSNNFKKIFITNSRLTDIDVNNIETINIF